MDLHNELQRRGKHGVLRYEDRTAGPKHSPTWTTTLYISDIEYAKGTGKNKQAARDEAAKTALDILVNEA